MYELVREDSKELSSSRNFGSRMVDEVKDKGTAVPYEKSRLVIQVYNDHGKNEILTQSPTIQRVSQRIILALAPSLSSRGITLFLRDITQAYVQSKTRLTRPVHVTPLKEMHQDFSFHDILKIFKPLYGIPESGTHWFRTYHEHHKTKLGEENSTYNPRLLIKKRQDGTFGIEVMQTDDTLVLENNKFINNEASELDKSNLLAKPIEKLTPNNSLQFNGCTVCSG